MSDMNSYKDLYDAFSKRYASELSKKLIQEKCNASWLNLKLQFKGEELKAAVDKKISELNFDTKLSQSHLLHFFSKVIKY